MAVTFVLGRAGSGKTRFCLDAIAAELARPDETRRLLFVVPEQAAFQMERALALHAPRGAYWRAEVLSFSRLAQRVFNELGFEPPLLRPAARRMALRAVLESRPSAARVFGAAAGTPGFLAQLDRLIEELLREALRPENLQRGAAQMGDEGLRRRGRALAELYAGYLEWFGPERLDPAQRLAALRARLDELSWPAEAFVWVDGFAGFTGEELETLSFLARRARELWITLLLDPAAPVVRSPDHPSDPLRLFHRIEMTYRQLRQRFEIFGVEVGPAVELCPPAAPRFLEAPALADLEGSLAAPFGVTSMLRRAGATDAGARPPDALEYAESQTTIDEPGIEPVVRVFECATHLDEIRAAAHHIRRSVRQSGGTLHFRDFALIARDLNPLADTIADVFTEYEIPHFIDRRRSLGSHALVRFARALLETLTEDFSVAAATRLLQCELLPLDRAQAETLENLILENDVHGLELWGRPNWEYEWQPELAADALATLHERRLRIVEALEPLVASVHAAAGATGAEWARRLHETFVALGTSARLEEWIAEARQGGATEVAETHRLAWEAWCDVLDDLFTVLGSQRLSAATTAAILGSALDELSVGLAPPTLDQVLVSSIERSRHPDIKYAWLMAFNDGIFPAIPAEDALLTTQDRERLAGAGLSALRSRREDAFAERLLAYIALTRPSRGLTISFAAADVGGNPLGPSVLLAEVLQALPNVAVTRNDLDDPPECAAEFARGYLTARAARIAAFESYEGLRAALLDDPDAGVEITRLLRGLDYRNAPPPIPGYARRANDPSGVIWSGSPSELERYIQCPFLHFAHHALRLAPRRAEAAEPLVLGRRAHEMLAAAVQNMIRSRRSVRDVSDEDWSAELERARREVDGRLASDFAARRPQSAFHAGTQFELVRETLLAQAGRWRRGDFEPLACERQFRPGTANALPALTLSIGDSRTVLLNGVIDRIDSCDDGKQRHLLVFDYKSSTPATGWLCLTQERLQAATYLLAVEQAFGAAGGARVAGVFFVPLYPKTEELKKAAGPEPVVEIERMKLYKPRGWLDTAVATWLDRELGQESSPVAQMKLKKDGGFNRAASRDVLTTQELDALLRQAEQTIYYGAERLARGLIDVTPLLEAKRLACLNCDYATVCRYEPAFNRPRRAETTLPTRVQQTADAGDEA